MSIAPNPMQVLERGINKTKTSLGRSGWRNRRLAASPESIPVVTREIRTDKTPRGDAGQTHQQGTETGQELRLDQWPGPVTEHGGNCLRKHKGLQGGSTRLRIFTGFSVGVSVLFANLRHPHMCTSSLRLKHFITQSSIERWKDLSFSDILGLKRVRRTLIPLVKTGFWIFTSLLFKQEPEHLTVRLALAVVNVQQTDCTPCH